ncbi:AI-2E family transporter, partial [Streptococcus sanguinis]|nr:AI-2E family transporter [Streptococcus sanguinis]
AAALIGGNLFGLVGMIFFTPIFAVIYRLVREFVVEKEKRNESGEVA